MIYRILYARRRSTAQAATLHIKSDPLAREVVHAVTWFGRKPGEGDESDNWSPYADEPSTRHIYRDFVKFHGDPWTVFEGDLPSLYKKIGQIMTI